MENNQMKKQAEQKKQRRKLISWAVIAVVVLMLAVMPILAAKNDAAREQTASILSGTVEYGSIETQLIGGGQLASEAAIKLKIPQEVKLTEYLVGNGDTVSKGDPIAKVDRISVMTAITGVQETLDELSKEILNAEDDRAASTVKAKVGGTVKEIFAEVGESAQDVMLRHGALAAVSLDDVMAVKVQCASSLDAGDVVCVRFPDDTEIDGRVEQNLEGILTITMEDDDYAVGTEVLVLTEDGDRLGKGSLYIFNQWNATAYSGTVSSILVTEGASLYAGQDIIRLNDPGHIAEFQRLIDKRHEYEELMQELFQMYRTETITAPCDGIVSGVDKNGAFLLSDERQGFVLNLLSNLTNGSRNLFEAYGVRVGAVTEEGMQMQVNGKRSWVEDLTDLSAISVNSDKMTQPWDYTGDTTVYVQDENGLLRADGSAKPGDILLAVGDTDEVFWFVRAEETAFSRNDSSDHAGITLLSNSTNLTLAIDRTTGVAGEAFSANLTVTPALKGVWSIQSEGFFVYNNVLYANTLTTGTHELIVTFTPEDLAVAPKSERFSIVIYAPYVITTETIPDGQKGFAYKEHQMEVSGTGGTGGTWVAYNLPDGLAMSESGVISGTPKMSGKFIVTVTYTYTQNGTEKMLTRIYTMKVEGTEPEGEGNFPGGDMTGGMGAGGFGGGGGMPGGGMSGGMMSGGMVQEEDPYYSLDKLTIASVTSQEQMTVEITIDELDISKVYIGQPATVTMDALGGESFSASVVKIANSGENEGGNSKFTVELTLEKNSDMLPGMTASARIVLDTLDNVLCIPAAALTEENGKTVVYTSYDSEKGILGTPVEIAIGAADADNVQILSDLEAGTTFYYAYYDTLEQDMMQPMGRPVFG